MRPVWVVCLLVLVCTALVFRKHTVDKEPALAPSLEIKDDAIVAKTGVEGYTYHCKRAVPNRALVTDLQKSELIIDNTEVRTGSLVSGHILSRDANCTAICADGDMYEVTAWSDENRVPVQIFSASLGVYKFSFVPKVAGVFAVCINLYFTSHEKVARTWPTYNESVSGNTKSWQKSQRDGLGRLFERVQQKEEMTCPAEDVERTRRCVDVRVEGETILPTAVCGQSWNGTRGLRGSWVKAKDGDTCYPGLCEGDLQFLSSDGWVWVPDACYLRVYNRESSWECLDKKQILWFGDSTLKQPATNLVENMLGVPVLRRSYNWVRQNCPAWIPPVLNETGASYEQHKKMQADSDVAFWEKIDEHMSNGCPNSFDHRQWRIHRKDPNSLRTAQFQFLWGGGKKIRDLPSPTRRQGLELLSTKTKVADAFATSLESSPDVVILHEYMWDNVALSDQRAFERRVKNVIDIVLKSTKATVHWDTSHAFCGSDHKGDCAETAKNKIKSAGAFQNAVSMVSFIEHEYGDTERVTVVDRYALSHPYAIGFQYCQFGLHYGSHPAACHAISPTNPPHCYRNWLVDKFELQMWMNKMCSNKPSEKSDWTIENGVTYEAPEGAQFTKW